MLGVQRILVLEGVMWKSRARSGPKVCGTAKVVFGQGHFLMPAMRLPLCFGLHHRLSWPHFLFPIFPLFFLLFLLSYRVIYWNLSHTSILQLKPKLVLEAFPNNFRLGCNFHLLIIFIMSVPHLGEINSALYCLLMTFFYVPNDTLSFLRAGLCMAFLVYPAHYWMHNRCSGILIECLTIQGHLLSSLNSKFHRRRCCIDNYILFRYLMT